MRKPRELPLVVGWREMVSLPELEVAAIKAKVDTGARTSALHATRIREETREGQIWVHFRIHPDQRSHGPEVEACAPLLERRTVRSSNGEEQERPVIRTTLALGERHWRVEVTLAARPQMGFRMLLGRTALRDHALVDPGRSFVASARPRRGR